MGKEIFVTAFPPLTERSWKDTQPLDRKSYRVSISDGGRNTVVEARIPLSYLEVHPDPEAFIKRWFEEHDLPKTGSVVDL